MNSLFSITNKLFKEIPYSKLSEEVKDKINLSFRTEYNNLTKSGQNDIQALGEIMHKYGTIESAGKFAGVDKNTLHKLKDYNVTYENKLFHKTVLIVKLLSFLTAINISSAIAYLIQGVVLLTPLCIVPIAIHLAIAYIFFRVYRKQCRKINYNQVCLSPAQKDQFDIYCDRHKKRFINSIFILIIFIVNYFTVFENSLLANMNRDETIVLVASKAYTFAVGVSFFLYCMFVSHFFLSGVCKTQRDDFKKYTKKVANICGIFLICVLIVTFILNLFIRNPYPVLYILTALFIIIGVIINSFYRCKQLFVVLL